MSLENEEQSGVPPIVEGDNPYNNPADAESTETNQKRSIAPLIAVIFIFIVVFGGLAVGIINYLGGDDKSTSIPVNSPDIEVSQNVTESTKEVSIPQTAGDVAKFIEPPLPKITQSEPIYEVVNATKLSEVDVENISFIISQLNKITTQMDALDKRLNAIDNTQGVQLNIAKETAENVVASITSTETIAATLLKQNAEVQQVKTIVSTENNRKKELLSQPPFRVAAVSMWGKTAYLTVESVSDSNFEQQVVIGSTISDWTLRSVSVPSKESVWVNISGVTYVLTLP